MYQEGVFFNGGMNTDDEDRLVPNGDYRYATFSRNYGGNAPSEGALQSRTGNLLQDNFNLTGGVNIVIGSCEDIESKALILFVWNDLNQHSIWRYTVEDAQYELILQDSILAFQKSNQIYHASVVNNLLYWTDNYFKSYTNNQFNPPRKINIQKAILYTQSGGTDPEGYSEITFNNLDWIKHPPLFSPTFYYTTDISETKNNLKNKLYQFRYQYIYDDNEESAWSPISTLNLPPSGQYISQTVNVNPFADNAIILDISTGSSIVKLIRVAYRIGNTGEFFLYNEYDKIELGWSDYILETITFKNETSGPAISNSERNYDLIPQIAKAIEYLPSSEFAIGNYVEGYDKLVIDKDITFSQNRYTIDDNKSAFTEPLADFINFYDSGPNQRKSIISFNNVYGNLFKKYRFQPGDILPIQLKDLQAYNSNTVTPDPILYFEVPYIDPVAWPTDQDKIKALCFVLIGVLNNIGISTNLTAPGTYSVGSAVIGWWTVEVLGKTWFNQTDAQISNTSSYVIPIIPTRNNYVTRTFKTGASHEFAIQYYDRANRDGTVQTISVGEVYVPFNTDLTNSELNDPSNNIKRYPYATQINMSIWKNFQPPIWATHYQVLYNPSTNISNFQQRSVSQIIYNPDSTIDLALDNYYLDNFKGASINQTPSKGDFVRFVRKRALFERELKILGIMTSVYTDYFLGVVNAATWVDIPYGPSFSETYDAASYISGYTFTPVVSSCRIDFKHTYSIYHATSSFIPGLQVRVILRNTTTLSNIILSTQVEPGNYFPNQINSIDFYTNVSLTPGHNYIVLLQMQHAGSLAYGGVHYEAFSGKITFSNGVVDYDDFSYYPEYVTNDINENYELNVMSYNPGAGPGQEDTITVNYFDANILGQYLTFTGTNASRPIATGGFQIEIYTPKKESQNDPWYEVGIEWGILDPHTSNRSHAGNIDQNLGVANAIVNLDCGDVYIRQRIMSTGYKYEGGLENTGDANDNRGSWFCEDPHYSDFYISNWNNKGRVGLFSPFAKQQHLKASIYHTNSLIDNTQINGLSRIEFFNNVVLKDEHGSINRLMQIGDTLKAFQDKKISSIYIQKAFALNGDGTNNVIISDKTFAGVRPHDDDYGCIHPGSVSKVENNVFFYDFYNAAAVQATQGGLVNICEGERKFGLGIENFTNKIRNYEFNNGTTANIVSHINRSNGEYILYAGSNISEIPDSDVFLTFFINTPNVVSIPGGDYTSIFIAGVSLVITNASNPSNNGTRTVTSSSYNAGLNITNIIVSPGFVSIEKPCPGELVIYPEIDISTEGIVYSFNRQRWSSYLTQPVIWATQFGNRAYTAGGALASDIGKLYEEDKGAELIFFNKANTQQVSFTFNSNPIIMKRFLTFTTQSNMPFSVDVAVPETNQYPSGMYSTISIANFRNQESYYVSKYFRDINDPNPFLLGVLKRLNGRELRGYVLNHTLFNSVTTKKMTLFSANVNFVPSEPLMQ